MFNPRLVLVSLCVSMIGIADASAQRKLAPGVLKVIRPEINIRDAHSLPMPMPGLKVDEFTPNFPPKSKTLFDQTRQIVFFRDVWQHEFAFLGGLRQMMVESRDTQGQMRKVNVWYMVYRLRNTGVSVSHNAVEDPKFGHVDHELVENPQSLAPITLSNRFLGRFTLQGWVYDSKTGMYTRVTYRDKVLPAITKLIQQEEDPDQPLLDTVQMATQILEKVPADTDQGGLWGVAIWYNVDPRIDYVSVQVTGLSNAYRIVKTPSGELDFKHKTLQINFWRPGDTLEEYEDVVDYGIPLVDDPQKQIEIARRYELPGPVLRGDLLDEANHRRRLIFEADAEVQMDSFESAVAAQLDAGQMPQGILDAFSNAGVTLGADANLEQRVAGVHWTVTDTADGKPRIFLLSLHPEFWEKGINDGIRFIRRLDHLWIYK